MKKIIGAVLAVTMLSASVLGAQSKDIYLYTGMKNDGDFKNALYSQSGIFVANEKIFVADTYNDALHILEGTDSKIIGKSGSSLISYELSGGFLDGSETTAEFRKPTDVAVSQGGDVYVCDSGNNVIRKLSKGVVYTVSGSGKAGYKNGKESSVMFNAPYSLAIAPDGKIYVSDTLNHCIRVIETSGEVKLFAGKPETSGFADGDLLSAQFFEPCGITIGNDGAIYVADSANHAIRKILNNKVTTVCGKPQNLDSESGYYDGGYVDGAAASFNFPKDLAVTDSGDIYVADTLNHAVRLIKNGATKTIVGNGEPDKFYLNTENMKLSRPSGIFVTGDKLYVSDTVNNTVVQLKITDELLKGRNSRESMLNRTGVTEFGELKVFVDGTQIDFSALNPWNDPDNVFLPVRGILEAMGYAVQWNDTGKSVTATKADASIILSTDQFELKNGRTVITLSEFLKLFKATYEWFAEQNIVAIETK